MTGSETFIVYARRTAITRARRFGLVGCLECQVERAILRGDVFGQGETRIVTVADGFVAYTRRLDEHSPGGRRRLLIDRVELASRVPEFNPNLRGERR